MPCREQDTKAALRLRAWLDDVRAERLRLEERLLAGAAGAASAQQETRSDLEAALLRLSRDKAALEADVAALHAEQKSCHEFLVRACGASAHPSCARAACAACALPRLALAPGSALRAHRPMLCLRSRTLLCLVAREPSPSCRGAAIQLAWHRASPRPAALRFSSHCAS